MGSIPALAPHNKHFADAVNYLRNLAKISMRMEKNSVRAPFPLDIGENGLSKNLAVLLS